MQLLTLVSNEPCGTGLRKLTFDQPVNGYARPGQFVTVHIEGHKPSYFAIASVPGAPCELLVKLHGETAELIGSMKPGAQVEVSDPIGHGFPMPLHDTRSLVILAAGSGLSAVRPVIEAEVAKGLPRPVTLFYGAFTPAHRAYVDRLDAWAEAGVEVRPVYSDPVPGWTGDTGFVQQAAHAAGFVRPDVTVLLCGFPQMVEEAKKLYAAAGADPSQVLVNF